MKISTRTFKEMVDIVSALVPECRVKINNEGISINAVDTANVAMVSLHLSPEGYKSEKRYEKDQIIGIDLNRIKAISSLIGKEDEIEIDLKETDCKLGVNFGNYDYGLSLIDINTIRKEPNPPDLPLQGKAKMTGKQFNDAIKGAALISDKITIGINPETETFFMEADGSTDKIALDLTREELISLTTTDARSTFSLDYLKDMGRVINNIKEVEIQIGTDFPVKLCFYFDLEYESGNGYVEYLLAPRIEN